MSGTLPDNLSEMRVIRVLGSVIGRFVHPGFDSSRKDVGFVTGGSLEESRSISDGMEEKRTGGSGKGRSENRKLTAKFSP